MYDGLHLNGTFYDLHTLRRITEAKQTEKHLADWERAFWGFLSAWLNDMPYVSVKTSGSTGSPKFIDIKKAFFIKSAQMTLETLGIKCGQSALLCLSPEYIAGKMMIVRALVGGLKLRVVSPQVERILQAGLETDFSAMVPLQINAILNLPDGPAQLSRIRCLLIGGAPITLDLEHRLANLDSEIYATYGMTETVSHIALRKLSGQNRSLRYKALPGVKISTDDHDCLVVHAPHLAESAVHTRDIVKLFTDDQFEVLGRFDHVINSGGIKYQPEMIEKKIEALIVDRFIISSLPDPRLGEKLILIIETEAPPQHDDKVLMKALKAILPTYEVPRMIQYIPKFPTVGNGKIARTLITREAQCRTQSQTLFEG